MRKNRLHPPKLQYPMYLWRKISFLFPLRRKEGFWFERLRGICIGQCQQPVSLINWLSQLPLLCLPRVPMATLLQTNSARPRRTTQVLCGDTDSRPETPLTPCKAMNTIQCCITCLQWGRTWVSTQSLSLHRYHVSITLPGPRAGLIRECYMGPGTPRAAFASMIHSFLCTPWKFPGLHSLNSVHSPGINWACTVGKHCVRYRGHNGEKN